MYQRRAIAVFVFLGYEVRRKLVPGKTLYPFRPPSDSPWSVRPKLVDLLRHYFHSSFDYLFLCLGWAALFK